MTPSTRTRPTLLYLTASAAMFFGALSPSLAAGFLTGPNVGDSLEIALDYLDTHRESLGLAEADLSDLIVTDRYVSSHRGVTHLYLRQRLYEIEVFHGNFNINIAADGSVISLGNRFFPGLLSSVQTTRASLSAVEAVERAAAELGIGTPQGLKVLEESVRPDRRSLLSDGGISLQPIPARLVYQQTQTGGLRLAWDLEIYQLDASHYWSVRIDAEDGKLLDVADFVDYEEYRVYPLPVESPNHTAPLPPADARVLEVDPYLDGIGSPFGWHDTDGVAGAEFTDTRGNNVQAQTDLDKNNVFTSGLDVRPSGGATLVFQPPIDLSLGPESYREAAVVNLFFWNNIIHDVMYTYGFDEPAGNFQANNYGNGGLGSDDVLADAQDGSGNCNANFQTPVDGVQPRMQMFTCDNSTPAHDGDIDNLVIVHEYGHGISERLTGGPSTVACLGNDEQMSEGWSDFYGLMFTQEVGDQGTDARPIATYLKGQPPTGPGIRPAPYSTDLGVNNFTFADLPGQTIPHGVGFIWATMVWEMTWGLIDALGFNPNVYGDWTTGGNNLALQLVTDGLKLQPCEPGFVDGRDAILVADVILTAGSNACTIVYAFAKRGLGWSADQGSPSDTFDGTEAFDLPVECSALVAAAEEDNICAGDTGTFTLTVNDIFTPPVAMSADGHPAGTTASFAPAPVPGPLPVDTVLTIGNTGSLPLGSHLITVTGEDAQMVTSELELTLNVFAVPPSAPGLILPADGALEVASRPTFEWTASTQEHEYILEVDEDPAFGSLDYSATVVGMTTHTPLLDLARGATFFWRVRSTNPCGGAPSTTFTFTTATDIDTTLTWNFESRIGPFGKPNHATWGQTFTVDPGDVLSSLTFFVGDFVDRDDRQVKFSAYLMEWDGERATGPILFESPPEFLPGSPAPGMTEFIFDTSGLTLSAAQYVAFLSASDYFGELPPTALTFVGWSGDVYSGGNSYYLDNGAVFSEVTSRAWFSRADDLAFRATFERPDLEAIEVYFRDQPGDLGDVIPSPAAGQNVYPHLRYSVSATNPVTGTITAIQLDATPLCTSSGTVDPGVSVIWCANPWTATAGSHQLTGRVDPNSEFLESDEENNEISETYVVGCVVDADCDNGLFCDGAETCDAVNGCQAGAPVDVDDGVGCTDDSCDEVNDVVVNGPNDALCDNGQFCDGAETCDPISDCQVGSDPCIGWPFCDESIDSCVVCLADAHCDNGDFCDGSENCNAGVCQPGTPPPDVISNTAIVGPVTLQACGTLTVGPSVTISGGPVVLRAESAVVFMAPVTVEADADLQVENGSPVP